MYPAAHRRTYRLIPTASPRDLAAALDTPGVVAVVCRPPMTGGQLIDAPQPGQIVRVRSRQYLVDDVAPPPRPGDATLVRLSCLDDDAQGAPSANSACAGRRPTAIVRRTVSTPAERARMATASPSSSTAARSPSGDRTRAPPYAADPEGDRGTAQRSAATADGTAAGAREGGGRRGGDAGRRHATAIAPATQIRHGQRPRTTRERITRRSLVAGVADAVAISG